MGRDSGLQKVLGSDKLKQIQEVSIEGQVNPVCSTQNPN